MELEHYMDIEYMNVNIAGSSLFCVYKNIISSRLHWHGHSNYGVAMEACGGIQHLCQTRIQTFYSWVYEYADYV
jgi:hypothetical protein